MERQQVPPLTHIFEKKPYPLSKEEAVDFLHTKIAKRRNDFIAEYRAKKYGTQALTYEPALNRETYGVLQEYQSLNPDAYQEVLLSMHGATRFDLETFIGERLNVGLSKYQYNLRYTNDGVGILYGQGCSDSLLEMIARGRDCRDEVVGKIDLPRQEAEIVQFAKIQEVLGNISTPIGSTIISISPPGGEGSSYVHNFYDVFVLQEDSQGKRYVDARRYASDLSPEKSLQEVQKLSPTIKQEWIDSGLPLDAFFLSRPVIVPEDHPFFNQPDEIHRILQGNPEALSHGQFQKKVLEDSLFSGMIDYYLQTLEQTPYNTGLLNKTLNAIMNRADEVVSLRCMLRTPSLRRDRDSRGLPPPPLIAQINQYGSQTVRQTTTGCGASGGFGQENGGSVMGGGGGRLASNMSPFRVGESARSTSSESSSGEMKCVTCPFCKNMVDAIVSSSKIECPDCHASVAKN